MKLEKQSLLYLQIHSTAIFQFISTVRRHRCTGLIRALWSLQTSGANTDDTIKGRSPQPDSEKPSGYGEVGGVVDRRNTHSETPKSHKNQDIHIQ